MNQKDARKRQYKTAVDMIHYITIILLVNLIGDLGIVYFAAAFECYFLLQLLFTGCLPDYVAKMVRSRMNKGQYKNADKVLKAALGYGIFAGIVGSLLLVITSGVIMEEVFRLKDSALALKLLAPAFFLQSSCAVLQGFFQGLGTTAPTILSEILKEVFGLVFVLMFGHMLYDYGGKVAALLQNNKFTSMYSASGAAIGISMALIFAIVFLLIMYLGAGRRIWLKKREGMRLTEDGIEVLRMLLVSVFPVALISFFVRIPVAFGLSVYAGKYPDNIEMLSGFGAIYGKTLIVIALLVSVVVILSAQSENTVIYYIKREEYKSARTFLAGGLQGMIMISSLFTVLCLVFSQGITELLFSEENLHIAVTGLQIASPIIVLLPVSLYLNRILMGIGMRLIALAGGVVAFVATLFTLFVAQKSQANDVYLLIYGLLAFAIAFCCWNMAFLLWNLRCNLPWLTMAGLPMLAAGITGLCMFLLHKVLVASLGEIGTLLVGTLIGGLVYTVLIFVMKCVREKELYALPGGRILKKLGDMFHLL